MDANDVDDIDLSSYYIIQRIHDEDIKRAREECALAGLPYPGWYWSDGVPLVGYFVCMDGMLVRVMSKTLDGFYGDAVYFVGLGNDDSALVDEYGFRHCMGVVVPRKYDPYKSPYYLRLAEIEKPRPKKPVQLSLFDFL